MTKSNCVLLLIDCLKPPPIEFIGNSYRFESPRSALRWRMKVKINPHIFLRLFFVHTGLFGRSYGINCSTQVNYLTQIFATSALYPLWTWIISWSDSIFALISLRNKGKIENLTCQDS